MFAEYQKLWSKWWKKEAREKEPNGTTKEWNNKNNESDGNDT